MKVLIIVDMQNDFINGVLGTKEAVGIVENVKRKIQKYKLEENVVIFTRDTHTSDYLNTQEGKNLPVEHCIIGTDGWEISKELPVDDSMIIDKPTFGSTVLAHYLRKIGNVEEIELIGLCTDICVISNAMILKASYPEIPITVDASCCAGVTPESHKNALNAMKMCQINIINE